MAATHAGCGRCFCDRVCQEDVALACTQTSAEALLQQLQGLYGSGTWKQGHENEHIERWPAHIDRQSHWLSAAVSRLLCLSVCLSLCSKYKFMESHLVQQQKGLLVKIPDISNALQALHHLMKKDETVSCHFELADSVFANAKIKKEDTVLLWLGANVMLEYSYDEADQLLTKNLKVGEMDSRAVPRLSIVLLCHPHSSSHHVSVG